MSRARGRSPTPGVWGRAVDTDPLGHTATALARSGESTGAPGSWLKVSADSANGPQRAARARAAMGAMGRSGTEA